MFRHVLDLAVGRGVDVVEPADLVPAPAGELPVHRRRHTVRRVIRRRDQHIVGDQEVAIRGTEI